MKALKIIGYVLALLLAALITLVWFLIFPFSGDSADKFGFAIGVVVYFVIFIIASIGPFLIGTVGAILTCVKYRARGLASFIVIALLPLTMSVLLLLSAYLV